MKTYVEWPLKESVKNKKNVFVKCFCSVCDKPTADRTVLQMERTTRVLCRSCSLKEKSAQALEKRKATCLEKYGVENPFQNENIKNRISAKLDRTDIGRKVSQTLKNKTKEEIDASNQKRKDTIAKNPNFYKDRQEKIQNTCLERYGVDCSLKTQAAKDGLKAKYDVDNISQSDYWKDSVSQTSLEKYGVNWPSQSNDVIDKIQATNLERYGFKYKVNDPAFRDDLYRKWTSEALQRYDLSLIGCELIGDVTLRCKKCGYERDIKHAQVECCLSFCPNCHNNIRSKFEFLVAEHLKQLGVDFVTNYRGLISPKEVDIYIPSRSLAIEIDGLYFHQNKSKDYHVSKTEQCKSKGVRLIHLTDKLLIEKQQLALSIIDSALGKVERVYARKCTVRELTSAEYKSFCDSNHIQGYVPAQVKLGLFYNNELVQIESFSKPRFNKKYEWELIRECSKAGLSIIGGKSKLFKHFIKVYNPNNIISYCDRSMFTGDSYKAIGMQFKAVTPPSYYYYKNGLLLSRYQCQKHKLQTLDNFVFDSEKSERENMVYNGFGVVYDCGENVFLWQK